MQNTGITASLAFAVLLGACASAKPAPPPPPPPRTERPPPPTGPTRTDFKTIARKLVGRCVSGGWIERWRSEHPQVDIARPKITIRDFEDRTKQELDQTYLKTTLEQRMRLSGVFDMVSDEASADFVGRGRLMRLAERTRSGRVSVYTVTLDLLNPKTEAVTYSCEASVKGEM